MSFLSTELGDVEPLVVRPKVACRLLAIGITRLYELIETGEIVSFRDGGARKCTTESIRNYLKRQIERQQPPLPANHVARWKKATAAARRVGTVVSAEVPSEAPPPRISRRSAKESPRRRRPDPPAAEAATSSS